jgi:hypothetical protein
VSLIPWFAFYGACFIFWLIIQFYFNFEWSWKVFSVFCLMTLSAVYCRMLIGEKKSIHYWIGESAIEQARMRVDVWRKKYKDGTIYVPSKDLAYALRDFGVEYKPKDSLENDAQKICEASKIKPILLVTRIREDSSFLFSPQMKAYRNCLSYVFQEIDIVSASSYVWNK